MNVVYRHWDADGVLLYVGVTDCISERTLSHAAVGTWFRFSMRTESIPYESRADALAAEAEAIRTENPLFNVNHTLADIDREDRAVMYLAENGALDCLTVRAEQRRNPTRSVHARDDQGAITTSAAATIAGVSETYFRREARKNGLQLAPDRWIDGRTPTYDPAAVKAWAESRQR